MLYHLECSLHLLFWEALKDKCLHYDLYFIRTKRPQVRSDLELFGKQKNRIIYYLIPEFLSLLMMKEVERWRVARWFVKDCATDLYHQEYRSPEFQLNTFLLGLTHRRLRRNRVWVRKRTSIIIIFHWVIFVTFHFWERNLLTLHGDHTG